jgi:hypothetical protein
MDRSACHVGAVAASLHVGDAMKFVNLLALVTFFAALVFMGIPS